MLRTVRCLDSEQWVINLQFDQWPKTKGLQNQKITNLVRLSTEQARHHLNLARGSLVWNGCCCGNWGCCGWWWGCDGCCGWGCRRWGCPWGWGGRRWWGHTLFSAGNSLIPWSLVLLVQALVLTLANQAEELCQGILVVSLDFLLPQVDQEVALQLVSE